MRLFQDSEWALDTQDDAEAEQTAKLALHVFTGLSKGLEELDHKPRPEVLLLALMLGIAPTIQSVSDGEDELRLNVRDTCKLLRTVVLEHPEIFQILTRQGPSPQTKPAAH